MAPIIQIVGYKNSGKTTLIARLVAMLHALNLRVAVIKHDVHGFEVDREGTDTYRHRQAGASAVAIVSPWRTAIVEERETPLADLIGHFQAYDLIIVEGFKREPYPKIVLIRSAEDEHLLTEPAGFAPRCTGKRLSPIRTSRSGLDFAALSGTMWTGYCRF